jgi:dolichol-phosphate mannosyltransferase
MVIPNTEPELSVVVPVFGCGDLLDRLHRRVVAALEPMTSFEIIYVDDADPHDGWSAIRTVAAQDERVRGLRLRENVGQQGAIAAGLAEARGRRTAVMDGDLQDPPEELPRFLATSRDGHPIVVGRRRDRSSHPPWRRSASALYSRLVHRGPARTLPTGYTLFSVLTRPVVEAYLQRDERFDVYILVVADLGMPIVWVDYEKVPRPEGRSSYTIRRLLRLAFRSLAPSSGEARGRRPVVSERVPVANPQEVH